MRVLHYRNYEDGLRKIVAFMNEYHICLPKSLRNDLYFSTSDSSASESTSDSLFSSPPTTRFQLDQFIRRVTTSTSTSTSTSTISTRSERHFLCMLGIQQKKRLASYQHLKQQLTNSDAKIKFGAIESISCSLTQTERKQTESQQLTMAQYFYNRRNDNDYSAQLHAVANELVAIQQHLDVNRAFWFYTIVSNFVFVAQRAMKQQTVMSRICLPSFVMATPPSTTSTISSRQLPLHPETDPFIHQMRYHWNFIRDNRKKTEMICAMCNDPNWQVQERFEYFGALFLV